MPVHVFYTFNSIYTKVYDFKNKKNNVELNNDTNEIIPIIISHGLTASRSLYSTLCSEFASFGYMVFALDHHDGTCCYTEDQNASNFWTFDSKMPYFKYEDFNIKINKRVQEVISLVDEIHEDDFL